MGSWTAATRWIAALAAVCGAVVPVNAGADGSPIVVTTTQSGVGVAICQSGCVQVVTVVNVSIVMIYVGTPPAASVRVTPRRIDFGAVQRGSFSPVRLVRLVNTGPTPLVVSGTGLTGPQSGDFGIRSTTCFPGAAPAALLQPRNRCTIGVGFSPSGPGRRDATLSLRVNQTTYGVQLTGRSARPPALTASPASLDFGNVVVRSAATRSLRLRNAGESPLTVRGLSVSGDYTLITDCLRGATPRALAAQAWCTVHVKFAPTAAGARAGAITVSDDAGGGPHVVPLSGTGVRAFMPAARVAATPIGGPGGDPSPVGAAGTNPVSRGRSDADPRAGERTGERSAVVANPSADPATAGQADSDSEHGDGRNAVRPNKDEAASQSASPDTQGQATTSTKNTPVVVPAPQTSTPGPADAVAPQHPRARADHRGANSSGASPLSPRPIMVPARRDQGGQDASVVATRLASHTTTTSTMSAPLRAAAQLPLVWWWLIVVLGTVCVAAVTWWQRTARARRLCGLFRN